MDNRPKFLIGHTVNSSDRYKASSGGIGTAIIRFLLSSKEYGTAITFQFNNELKMYEPKLIYSEEDLNVCGSVYQDINLAQFVKDNIKNIKEGIVVSCPPCQVAAIRNTLNKNGIKSFIVSFCCSGQTTVEGTWKYYEFLGISKDDVANLQYRGNGWPSGIQITLKDGKKIFHDNWTEPWITIHQAGFYRPKRCFYCTFDSSYHSDISLADPWLKDYLEKDKIGNTLFFANTAKGIDAVSRLRELGMIVFVETDYNSYYTAQQPNVEKENRKKNQQKEIKNEVSVTENRYIRNYFTKSLFRMRRYIKYKYYLSNLSTFKGIKRMIMNLFDKVLYRLRYWFIAPKLGSHEGKFNIREGGNVK